MSWRKIPFMIVALVCALAAWFASPKCEAYAGKYAPTSIGLMVASPENGRIAQTAIDIPAFLSDTGRFIGGQTRAGFNRLAAKQFSRKIAERGKVTSVAIVPTLTRQLGG